MYMIEEKIEQYLLEWENWCTRNMYQGIGWHTYSMLTKIGEGKSDSPVCLLPELNEIAEEIEKFVVQLAKTRHELARALRVYYCEPGTVRVKAKQLGLSTTLFLQHVENGKERLTGYIEAMIQNKKLKYFYLIN